MPALIRALTISIPPEKIFRILVSLVVVIILLVTLLISPLIYLAIPLAEPEQVDIYISAAQAVSDSTKTEADPLGLTVNWQELIAIDTVLLNQDFSKANLSNAKALAQRFIKQTGTTSVKITNGDGTQTKISCQVYKLLSLGEVLEQLERKGELNNDERERIAEIAKTEFGFIAGYDDLDVEILPDWFPVKGEWNWPLPNYYSISSPFGLRIHPKTGVEGFHAGIDIPGPIGTPVIASRDGIVIASGFSSNAGLRVNLGHVEGIVSKYMHLSKSLVEPGDIVKAGQVIAFSGNTGRSTGPHLHFEIRVNGKVVNPQKFFK